MKHNDLSISTLNFFLFCLSSLALADHQRKDMHRVEACNSNSTTWLLALGFQFHAILRDGAKATIRVPINDGKKNRSFDLRGEAACATGKIDVSTNIRNLGNAYNMHVAILLPRLISYN
jgi:hypothetical protein